MKRAFLKAERLRRVRRPPSPAQRRYLTLLAERAGIEVPSVNWSVEASEAIGRLERLIRQPSLEGM